MPVYYSEEIKANNIQMGRKLLAYDKLVVALREIAKPEGAWSNDRETYYKNIIESVIRIAETALTAAGEKV